MTANEALVHILKSQQQSFLEAVKHVPEDRLDWVMLPGQRSVRDQFQEVATIVTEFWDLYSKRKLDWSEERWEKYLGERKAVHSVADLEAALCAATDRLIEHTMSLQPEDWMAPTEVPFPGEHFVIDHVYYHVWNMAYHEGQINSVLQAIEGENAQ